MKSRNEIGSWMKRLSLLVTAVAVLACAAPAAAHHSGEGPGSSDDGSAGTIASFDSATGTLVIDLAGGGTISGQVTRWTWIKDGDDCDDMEGRRALHGWCRKQLNGSKHGDHGRHRGWDHSHPRGDTSDLVAGATVEDALLALKDGRAWFWKIELED